MKNAFTAFVLATAILCGADAIATKEAPAATVYHNGNKTTVHTNGYYGPRVAPHKTTIKHNDKKDTVKVCREYYFGTKNCAKWSY